MVLTLRPHICTSCSTVPPSTTRRFSLPLLSLPLRLLQSNQMSCPATHSGKRGASDPVFLHFTSFSQLSVHRTCTLQQQYQGDDNVESYEALVRREAERRRLGGEQPVEFYRPHAFSAALLDAAYHSVVNATSRARSTNDAQYVRLRQAAMKREKRRSVKRPRLAEVPNDASVASTPSIINTPDAMALTEQQRSALVHLLEMAASAPCPCPDVGSTDAKPVSEVNTQTQGERHPTTHPPTQNTHTHTNRRKFIRCG